jgi:type VI secretion system protein ImpC
MSDSSMQTVTQKGAATETVDLDDFDALLMREFKPRTKESREMIFAGVRALAEQALADDKRTRVVPENAIRTIEEYISAIDEVINAQMNVVLHHPEFQRVESAWRGLHFLVSRTETDEMLKIKVEGRGCPVVQALQRHHLGSEPAVQEDLRGGIRPVGR